MLRPRPAVLGIILLVSVVVRLLPYILRRLFDMNIDPDVTVYPWNFSPLPAICLFGAAFLPRKSWAYLVPLAAYLLSDLGIWALTGHVEFAFYPSQPIVYGCIALTISLGFILRKHRSAGSIAATGLVSATLFFLVTNFGVWLVGGGSFYPMTADGLATCYVAGIPFFRNSLISLAVFCPLLFSSAALLQQTEKRMPSLPLGETN
ncbi:MAG: hypothetical protein HON53_23385 [Planctomycetaceae bacterium]|jgi:hypothetical protein|nr:hypothetical protein [Planctomycetaceae bacterium]MBT6156976.1 hypothetical protein [Planctomycetaceae bacterium]MBT6484644.1 hypothetical protein [Planctomycetaceae bacterium]MBT6494832.1 hypothetical protein [Planctomycetaceae bacterium]